MKKLLFAALVLAACAAPLQQTPPAGLPAQVPPPTLRVGETWSYDAHHGYTRKPRGTLEYR
jgi:hypothetical protein